MNSGAMNEAFEGKDNEPGKWGTIAASDHHRIGAQTIHLSYMT